MARTNKDDETTVKEGTADVSGDLGTGQVKQQIDEWNEQGFRGVKVDPTPNENYTVAGVTSGAPTPETDATLQEEAAMANLTGTGSLRSVEEANKATLDAAAENGLDTSTRTDSDGTPADD